MRDHLPTPFLLAIAAAALLLMPLAPAVADESSTDKASEKASPMPAKHLDALTWRSIGPANMMGRITALAVDPKRSTRWYAATASGGLLKTENNGHTFQHLFDKERVVSIGAVAVSPSRPEEIWVGTGESNPRNSVSWGNGVYKSTDAGATWKHMGLKESFQIGAVVVHPTDPDVVYVGALGRLWGPNKQRGLFKTTDGGATWKHILAVDERTGVVDVKMHPTQPDTLLVMAWERERDAFDTNDPAKRWGPGSALYRTTDGGANFEQITDGLPTKGNLGRMCADFCLSQPDTVFLLVDVDRIGQAPADSPFMGINGANAETVGARLTRVTRKGPADKSGLKAEDVIIGIDGERVHDYAEFIRMIRTHRAGDVLKLEVLRERKSVEIDLTLGKRPGNSRSPFSAALGGQRENMQNDQGADGHEYGGVYRSEDAGKTWKRINSLNPRPMYFSHIRVHPHDPQQVWVCGIRLWRSRDGGKTFRPDGHGAGVHVDHHAIWIDPRNPDHVILGNDGGIYVTYDDAKTWDHLNTVAIGQCYHVGIGPNDDYRVYTGLQDNGSWGAPSRVRHGSGPTNPDWVRVGGGDGFRCLVDQEDPNLVYFESQNGGIGRRNLATGERASLRPRAPRGTRYRFNWNTPFLLSNHNSRIYYVAGNMVFRSLDRGSQLRAISPDITNTRRGSATALAESPRNPDVLYVGTDDGALHVTRDGGKTWTDIFAAPPADAPKNEAAEVSPSAQKDEDGDGEGETEPKADEPATDKAPAKAPAKDAAKEAETAEKPTDTPEPTAEQRAMLERMMRRDRDGNGTLSKDEWPGPGFERIDSDGNGELDRAEVLALMRRGPNRAPRGRRAARRTRGGTPGGKPLAELMTERPYVSWIEASRFVEGRVYVAFDAHRSNDDRPHLFVSEDFGATWRSILGDLPADCGSTRTIREDLVNRNLLFIGTEFGAYATIDRGEHWHSLNTNLPTVAVHAFALHPRVSELVAATHGRSIWILDINALRQMTPETVAAPVHLYRPGRTITWRPLPSFGASRTFRGQNPGQGGRIQYALKDKAESVTLEIMGPDGKVTRTLDNAPTEAGLHTVVWDLRANRPANNPRVRRGRRVAPGTYTVSLKIGDKTYTQPITVTIDPAYEDPRWMAFADQEEAEDDAAADAKWLRKFAPFQGED